MHTDRLLMIFTHHVFEISLIEPKVYDVYVGNLSKNIEFKPTMFNNNELLNKNMRSHFYPTCWIHTIYYDINFKYDAPFGCSNAQ